MFAAAADTQPAGATLRPKIVYAVTDDWKMLAGTEIFRGETASAFGLLRRNCWIPRTAVELLSAR